MKTDHELMQELFNTMWTGLSAQGWQRSVTAGGICKYHGEGGLKCAVGHCIPDELYSNKMEGGDVYDAVLFLPEDDAAPEWADRGRVLDFMADAQARHDHWANPEGMRQSFVYLADEYRLTVPGKEPH